MSIDQDHFALFGLERQFAIDHDALDAAYRAVQAKVHPDRFASASDAEKRVALQWATRVNEAYRTLRDPLRRAVYLCELGGVDLQLETSTAMPSTFLMQQMEWRETLEEARAARELPSLQRMEAERVALRTRTIAEIGILLDDSKDTLAAAAKTRQLMFLDKFGDDVALALESLEITDP